MQYDDAIDKAGGLGIYQGLLLVLNAFINNYGCLLIYNFGFMTATPKFLCVNDKGDDIFKCTRDEICKEGKIFYKIDSQDPSYIGGYFD